MKKYFFSFLSLLIVAVLFVAGCTNPAMPKTVGERLEYNLNVLQNTIKNLDTLDNNYLINPDISPSPVNVEGALTVAASANTHFKNFMQRDAIGESNGLFNNLESEQINESATQENRAQKVVELNQNNNQPTQNKIAPQKTYDIKESDSTSIKSYDNNANSDDNWKRQADTNNVEVRESTTIKKQDNDVVDVEKNIKMEKEKNVFEMRGSENSVIKQENALSADKQQIKQSGNNLLANSELQTSADEDKMQEVAVKHNNNQDEESIDPIKHVSEKEFYDSRFVADNINVKNPAMDNYIEKIQKLYAMTNDSVEANNEFESKKASINLMIDELRKVAIKLKTGKFEPNRQQIIAINNYIGDIRTTISRLRGVNGQLNNEVNKISNVQKNGMTTSIDVLNSNYIRILNHIDVRITYLKNALSTLEEIKELLHEAQNNTLYEDEFADQSQLNNTSPESTFENEHIYNNENVVNNESVNDKEKFNENNYDEHTAKNKRNFNNIKERDAENRRNFSNNLNDYDKFVNIDTYGRANRENSNREIERYQIRRNIDSFNGARRNNSSISNDNKNNQDVNNIDNINQENNYNKPNDSNYQNTYNHPNNPANNADLGHGFGENLNNPNNTGLDSEGGFYGNNFRNDSYYRNMYHNDRITQNNINPGFRGSYNRNNPGFYGGTNNSGFNGGVNNFGYNNAGFNNMGDNIGGVAGDGVINNRGNAYSTVADEHGNVYREGKLIKNTDTYKQNTLIDILNQGTVNNGINTLSLGEKTAEDSINTNLSAETQTENISDLSNENIEGNVDNSVVDNKILKQDVVAKTDDLDNKVIVYEDKTKQQKNTELNSETFESSVVMQDEIVDISDNVKNNEDKRNKNVVNNSEEESNESVANNNEYETVFTQNEFELEKNKLIGNLFTSDTPFTFV